MNFNAGNYELAMAKVAKMLNKHILFTDTLGNFRATTSMGRIPVIKGNYVVATAVNADALLKDAVSNNRKFYEQDVMEVGSVFDTNNKHDIEALMKEISAEQKYKLNNTNEILNSKVRQLDMFLQAKKGLSALSKVLSVNQGLNSTVEEAFIYLTEVSKALSVEVKNLDKRLDDLSKGIYKISEEQHGYEESLFSVFDLGFILSKNKAAINNLKAEILKYNTINSTNKMTQALHSVLAGVTAEDIEELQTLEQEKFDN
jgi:dephospho-CoA kinase